MIAQAIDHRYGPIDLSQHVTITVSTTDLAEHYGLDKGYISRLYADGKLPPKDHVSLSGKVLGWTAVTIAIFEHKNPEWAERARIAAENRGVRTP